ncbi:MAG: patatin-like phospholipase family protein, partial [Rickettsiales bacterium]|nr:patatin-like phospholipase family protein [Rickettsiales bacterium]
AIVDEMLDLEAIHNFGKIKLFIAATHVASGQARVFHCSEITADVLMASTCIPFLFQAVEIEGEQYWDGGYMGNPAIWPLIYNCESEDVILVQINPLHDNATPKTASEIINRLNEITFNSSLIAEMRAIEFVRRLLDEGKLDPKKYKAMRLHLVYSPDQMHNLNASSKMNANWDFFQYLRDLGRADAETFVQEHWKNVGITSTLNIQEKFLCGPGKAPITYGNLPERIQQKMEKMDKAGIAVPVQKKVVKQMVQTTPPKAAMKQPHPAAQQKKAPPAALNKQPKADKKKQVKKAK